MGLDYGLGTMTATTYKHRVHSLATTYSLSSKYTSVHQNPVLKSAKFYYSVYITIIFFVSIKQLYDDFAQFSFFFFILFLFFFFYYYYYYWVIWWQ